MEPTPASGPLTPLVENWQRALCIVAHPDDVEFGIAGGIARWTGQGKQVSYAMVTSGEAGIDGVPPESCRPLREAEQVEAARVVGVETVDFLGFPDGVVEYGLPLRRAIAETVRRHQPDIVITGQFRESFGPGVLNQADHVAVGRAVLDGVRDAANRWVFPEQLDGDLEPWPGVREVWAIASPLATHGVDTTETFDRAVEALGAHAAYLEGLGWKDFDFREMLEGFHRQAGQRLGTTYAETAEVFVLRASE